MTTVPAHVYHYPLKKDDGWHIMKKIEPMVQVEYKDLGKVGDTKEEAEEALRRIFEEEYGSGINPNGNQK